MFDRIAIAAPAYPQQINSTVIEKKAPTDASVSLLREMERKAKESITNLAIFGDKVSGNVVGGFVEYTNSPNRDLWVSVEVMGKRESFCIANESMLYETRNSKQIVEAVAKAFADAVAQHMIRRLVALGLKEQGK